MPNCCDCGDRVRADEAVEFDGYVLCADCYDRQLTTEDYEREMTCAQETLDDDAP